MITIAIGSSSVVYIFHKGIIFTLWVWSTVGYVSFWFWAKVHL